MEGKRSQRYCHYVKEEKRGEKKKRGVEKRSERRGTEEKGEKEREERGEDCSCAVSVSLPLLAAS